MFSLTSHVANKPIMDDAYLRHLRTADVFNALTEARQKEAETLAAVNAAIIAHDAALERRKTEEAKAKLMASMEDN
jgi:putative N-acetylmannosamine-6-phosphate epimerase